jgi:hypothetical protein
MTEERWYAGVDWISASRLRRQLWRHFPAMLELEGDLDGCPARALRREAALAAVAIRKRTPQSGRDCFASPQQ